MSNPIILPPLPEPAITMKHGPWKPSQFDDYETYCAHCLTRSIFAHSRRCDPRIDPESLRARDLEVARVVLEGARPEPDCRTCQHMRDETACAMSLWGCTNGDHYAPLPPVRLWRKA